MMQEEVSYTPDSQERSMTLLLFKDFLYRYWWVIPLIILLCVPEYDENAGRSFILAGIIMVIGAVLVAQERGRDVWQHYRALPISRSALSRILWLEGVMIFPLAYLVWNLAVIVFRYKVMEVPPAASMIEVLVTVFAVTALGIGYSSLMILILPYLPRGEREYFNIRHIIPGLLWGILFLGAMPFPYLFLNVTVIELSGLWKGALLLSCPVLAMISYLLRYGLLKDAPEKVTQYRWVTPAYSSSTTSFWFQFWLQQSGVIIIGMVCCFVLVTIVNLALNDGEAKSGMSLIFFLFLLFVVPAFSVVWGDDIRALRILPMTTSKLGYFLLLIPTVNILCITVLLIMFNLGAGRVQNYWGLLLAFAPAIYAMCLSIIVARISISYGKRSGTAFLLIIFFTYVILWPLYIFLIPVLGLVMFSGIKKQILLRSVAYRYARGPGIEDYVDDFDDIEEDLLLTRGIAYCQKHTTEEPVHRTLFDE